MKDSMSRLRETLHASTGLAPSEADLARALREQLPALADTLAADYAPLPGTPEFEALVDRVVVPESWMLRDPAVFAEALRFVQARLAAQPLRTVTILSVPCAGGEEPYSMALVLAQAGIQPGRCRIDAIDLSQAAIARARSGRFSRNAFRGADLAFRERWFTREGDDYVVDDALRAYVRFSQGNLLAMGARADLPPYDLVFCRNLLIYFDAAHRARAAHAIAALLADDGLLLSGHAEAPSFCGNGFAPAHAGHVLRKQAAPASASRSVSAAPVAARPRVRKPVRALPASAPLAAPAPAATPAAKAVAKAPAAAPDLLADARRHADAGQLEQAEAACRACLAAVPDSADAWFLLGTVQECSGQMRAADASWRRCVYLAPDHYEAMCSLALLHESQGDTAAGAGFRQRAARIFARRGSTSA